MPSIHTPAIYYEWWYGRQTATCCFHRMFPTFKPMAAIRRNQIFLRGWVLFNLSRTILLPIHRLSSTLISIFIRYPFIAAFTKPSAGTRNKSSEARKYITVSPVVGREGSTWRNAILGQKQCQTSEYRALKIWLKMFSK